VSVTRCLLRTHARQIASQDADDEAEPIHTSASGVSFSPS
jgi:hypothetical protein